MITYTRMPSGSFRLRRLELEPSSVNDGGSDYDDVDSGKSGNEQVPVTSSNACCQQRPDAKLCIGNKIDMRLCKRSTVPCGCSDATRISTKPLELCDDDLVVGGGVGWS